MKKLVKAGSFTLTSGKVLVSDPCYIIDGHEPVWCMGTLENVLPGKWTAHADYRKLDDWGKRVFQIWALHESLKGKIPARGWKAQQFEVGVDSGQAGIYEANAPRPDGKGTDAFDKSHWYGRCCNITCPQETSEEIRERVKHDLITLKNGGTTATLNGERKRRAKAPVPVGIIDGNGVVASSGFGDGGYSCRTLIRAGEIVGITVRFL